MRRNSPSFFWLRTSVHSRRRNRNNSNANSDKNEDKQNEVNPIFIHVPEGNISASVTEQQNANMLTKISIWINTLLLLGTLGALFFTKRSVDIAEQTLTDSRTKDSINARRDSVVAIKQSEKDSLTIELAYRTLDAQENATKASQQQFEKTYRPFLNLKLDSIRAFTINAPLDILVTLQNQGNYPANIYKNGYRVTYGERFKKERLKYEDVAINLSKDFPLVGMTATGDILTQAIYDKLKKEEYFIYVYGEYYYLNESNNAKYMYEYAAKIEINSKRFSQLRTKNMKL